jgi:uncharacterized membrane protein (UPF0127 family)
VGRLRLLAGALALAAALAACGPAPTPTPAPLPPAPAALTDGAVYRVEAGNVAYAAEVASSAYSRALGLSGRASLPPSTAMLFDLGSEREASFWMREMRFALDMVWMRADWSIVAVTHDVPPPAPGTPEADLPLYGPGEPVRFVLEVRAGEAAIQGIAPGGQLRVTAP